jgi:signal transduction histidine kinase
MTVRDTGIGMRAEDVDKALEPFGQIENAHTRRHQGTGLGLPLAKRLVELHGGSLSVASALGVGTEVTVRFPPERTIREFPAAAVLSNETGAPVRAAHPPLAAAAG